MTKQQQKEFLSRPADGNIMRLAQTILKGQAGHRHQITCAWRKLISLPGVKDMTMKDVSEALEMISEKGIEGTGALAD